MWREASRLSDLDAVIFDFDLTLADSLAGVAACANYALRALGFPAAEPEAVRRTIGLSLVHSFHALSASDDAALASRYARHFGEHADRVMAELICLFPGVVDAIGELRCRGLRTAIVSTKFRYRIEDILGRSGASGLVDVIVGGEDVAHHKPHPEGLHRALALLRTPSSHALYVGDHRVDAEAARAAGIPFVGVLSGATDAVAWADFSPRHVIADIRELPATLFGDA
jgi:phosphoglycolate phosphatase